ncbi:unnamed protein product [Prorocentrum cordatum]|uniref:Uncharacterized protein n=1 Tax=Prorocentrum cordatum TaxID=2364126 RepID=A0ABN9SL53_9DINO|nr:unnamed protein product [Polarella glacialis]
MPGWRPAWAGWRRSCRRCKRSRSGSRRRSARPASSSSSSSTPGRLDTITPCQVPRARRVPSVSGVLRDMEVEKAQVSEAIMLIREQQEHLQATQQRQQLELQELMAALRERGGAASAFTNAPVDEPVAAPADPTAAPSHGHGEDLLELRAEVAVLANAINALCGRVDELSGPPALRHGPSLQGQLGTIATAVADLSERVQRGAASHDAEEAPVAVAEPRAPVTPPAPGHLRSWAPAEEAPASHAPPMGARAAAEEFDEERHSEAVRTPCSRKALQRRLAAMVGGAPPCGSSSGPPSSAGGPFGEPPLRREPPPRAVGAAASAGAGGAGYADGVHSLASSTRGASVSAEEVLFGQGTGRKVPNPMSWLTEPLSISVQRDRETPMSLLSESRPRSIAG